MLFDLGKVVAALIEFVLIQILILESVRQFMKKKNNVASTKYEFQREMEIIICFSFLMVNFCYSSYMCFTDKTNL